MVGECGKCKSVNLDYGDLESEGESIYYEFECEDCGAKGREYYDLEYSKTVMNEEGE